MNIEYMVTGNVVRFEGVLLVLGVLNLRPYLIEGGDDVINYVLSTVDDKVVEHAKKLNRKLIKIQDDKFLEAVGNQISPVAGNYYSYVCKIVIEGTLSRINNGNDSELAFSDIVSAVFENSWGDMICMELDRNI